MKKCYQISVITTIILLSTLFGNAQKNKFPKKDYIKLYNGKDFSNWDIKIAGHKVNDNYKNTFKAEKKFIRISYDEYQNFGNKYGHMYFKTPFSYYILEFEYRFLGSQTPGGAVWNNRNSGIMFHSQSAESNDLGQSFPVSLELQLLGGLGTGKRYTGNLCTPGTQVYMNNKLNNNHCIDSKSATYDGDRWVKAKAIVFGDSIIHHIIESDTVLTYQKPIVGGNFVGGSLTWQQGGFDNDKWEAKNGTALTEGYIALQAESHAIDFKNIKLLNLKGCTDPKAKNYKKYFVKADNSICKY